MRAISNAVKEGGIRPVDIQVKASTGTGKTVALIKAAADNDISNVLVMLHRQTIMEGWYGSEALKKGLVFFFGQEWVDKNVGIVQQDRQEWDKPVVLAMAPTLVRRDYPEHIRRSRGLILVDELHKFAAPVLQQALSMFPARVRIGTTATEKEGGMAIVVNSQFGSPSIISEQQALQPKVIDLHIRSEVNWRNYAGPEGEVANVKSCDTKNMMLQLLPRLHDRTQLLMEIAYQRGYSRGRQGIIIGDRVEHLIEARRMMIDLGADPDQCGIYVGSYKSDQYKLTGKVVLKGGEIKHLRSLPLFDTRAKAESYVRRLKPISQNITIKRAVITLSADERRHIEENCQFMFVTYGIFDTGVDISRLDWAMELTPRGNVTQAVGRILRVHADKPVPVWYNPIDYISQIVTVMGNVMQYRYSAPLQLAKRRLKSYNEQNAIISVIGNPRDALNKA